jgi:hypothetical protein
VAAIDSVLGPYRNRAERPARITELVRRIEASCMPVQRPFVMEDAHRKQACLTSRRAGKTSGVIRKIGRGAELMSRARYLYIALSRPTAEEILWDPLKQFADEFEIPSKFYESSLTMEFTDTGSTLQLLGADDKKECDKKRGQKYHGAAVDEAASFPGKMLKYLLDEVLRWSLMDFRGWLALVGTPGNLLTGPFYSATREGAPRTRKWKDRDSEEWAATPCTCSLGTANPCTSFAWSMHAWGLEDNIAQPHLWLEALAEKEQEGWTDENPIWVREALGRWAADDTGRVYRYRKHIVGPDGKPIEWNTWTPLPKSKANPFGLPEGHKYHFVLGGDLGSRKSMKDKADRVQLEDDLPGGTRMDREDRNKTILGLFAYADTSPNFTHAHERVVPPDPVKGSITRLAEEIKAIEALCAAYSGATLDAIVIDDGNRSGGGMICDELAAVHEVPAQKADKANKANAIELVNSDLVDGRMKVLPGSHLEAEMEVLQWDESGQKENPSQANDACDTATYARKESLHTYGHELPPEPPAPPPEKPARRERKQPPRPPGERPPRPPRKPWFGDDDNSTEPNDDIELRDDAMPGAGNWGME